MSLVEYNKQYEDIIHSDQATYEKDLKLAGLMSDLEKTYHIPAMKNEEWEAKNKAVIAMYRKVSMSRNL